MSEQPTLETPRLLLRGLVPGDAPEVERLAGAPEVAATTLTIPHPYPPGAATEWIAAQRTQYAEGKAAIFAITLKESGALVGSIGLHRKPEFDQAELGYWIGVPYWDKGYATEAGRAVLEFGFDTLGLERIHAHYFTRNPASGRVMDKLGMTREGTLRHAVKKGDGYEDLILYAMLRGDRRRAPADANTMLAPKGAGAPNGAGASSGERAPGWDPAQYERFRDERARPFHDLVARIPEGAVKAAADLGCGTGELTRTLADRWPSAQVWGIDSSSEMLERARAAAIPGRLEFIPADLRDWTPPVPLDRILANAALHWVPDHRAVLARLAGFLAPDGVLAVQMPDNRAEPAYRIMIELLGERPWSAKAPAGALPPGVESAAWYARTLAGMGMEAAVWHTDYYHRLGDARELPEWLRGSILRPALALFSPAEATAFLAELETRIRPHYPREGDGILFPFRRLFFVAIRRSAP